VVEDLRFRRLGDVRDRTVNVRLIAATHRDLPALVREQKFREDLYYRINALPLVVPPLRERGQDVVALARGLVERIAADLGRPRARLSEEAEAALLAAAWPGNVRQLRNVLERAILLAEREVLDAAALGLGPAAPAASREPARGAPLTLEEAVRRHIESVLQIEGSVPRAAELLGLSRSSLYERIRKHGIELRKS
jgi:DNA-binding NtrC family response regulator